MNEKVAKWIIEFLLRQTIDDKIINGVLSCLPLSNDDNRLKKTILLRNVGLEVSNGSVSEKLLEYLEIIEELDHEEGKKASNLMKEAYCAVAVDCTVRFLEDDLEENAKYLETIERVWKNRVCKIEGLVSEESNRWLSDLEAAMHDSQVFEKIWTRNTRNEALRTVKSYVKEAWNCMRPAFLESMATKAGNEVEELCRGWDGGDTVRDGGDTVMDSEDEGRKSVASDGIQNSQSSVRRKHYRRPRGAKFSDADEDAEESMNAANDDPTSIMDKVQEIHHSDSMQLHAGVNVSHLDACQVAHNLSFTKAKESTSNTDAANNMTVVVTRATPEVEAIKSSSGELNVVVTDPHSNALNLSFTKANESTSNVDAAKNKTVPVMHASPEVTRVQETLISSFRELHAAVIDPLPDALKLAAAFSRKGVTGNDETAVGNQTGAEIHAIPRVDSMQQVSESRSMKVHAVVQNPGLDAFQPVQNVSSKTAAYDTSNDPALANNNMSNDPALAKNDTSNDPALANRIQDVSRESTDKNIEVGGKEDEHNGNNQVNGTRDPKEPHKRKLSLRERKVISYTLKWDDSIDNLSSDLSGEPCLRPSSSNRRNASPSRPYLEKKTKIEPEKWTPQEEDVLRDAVSRFGRRWKYIIDRYATFAGRKPCHLHDKWRNMMGRRK